MQNLIKYPKRHNVVSQRLVGSLFKYNSRRNEIVNVTRTTKNINNEMNRLRSSVSHSFYIKVHKETYSVQSSILKNGSFKIYRCPKFLIARNFSTTPYLSNKNNPEGSPEGSSEGPKKDPKKPDELRIILLKMLIMVLMTLVLLLGLRKADNAISPWNAGKFDWNQFVHEFLLKGEVEQIVIENNDFITIYLREGAIYKGRRLVSRALKVYDSTYAKIIEDKIREVERNIGISAENGVSIKYVNRDLDMAIITAAFIGGIIYLLFRTRKNLPNLPNPMDFITQSTRAKYTLVEPFSGKGVRFDDVAGLKEAKIEVMEFVDYLKNPERYNRLGAKVPKGALLLGPPGCGKTLLAKAVATEANVPFFSMNGSEFIEMIGGVGAARVRDLFADAKKRAPSIIYIDEIDAVGKKRSDRSELSSMNEFERTLNQLLVEMDGMTSANDVILLASTNRADVLDKALLRPGRFDRHISIDLPTVEERKQIFEYHLKSLSLQSKPPKYSGYLAYLTPGFSGADIANVCNEAALHAAREKKSFVCSNDLMYAIDRTIGGMTKKSSSQTPSTKKVVAYHEAGHAVVGWLLEHTDALLKVTIVPRTTASLGFAQYTQIDNKLLSKEALFEKICMMLGGRTAENLIFNQISTGAEDDLQKVTKIAYSKVQEFGMSPTVGLISFDPQMTSTGTKKPYSKRLANLMDAEVRRIVTEAYKKTETLLVDNKDKLVKIAEALLEKETLTYDDVEKLIGPPPFGKKRLVEPADFIADIESPTTTTPTTTPPTPTTPTTPTPTPTAAP